MKHDEIFVVIIVAVVVIIFLIWMSNGDDPSRSSADVNGSNGNQNGSNGNQNGSNGNQNGSNGNQNGSNGGRSTRVCGGAKGAPGRLFNTLLEPSSFPVKQITNTPVPAQFDGWRQRNLLLPPRNQRSCGSCWAFSAVGVLGHRISIATQGLHKVPLSAQYLVSCDANASGCDGAESLHTVFGSLTYSGTGLGIPGGTVAESVYPYEEPENNAQTQPCRSELVRGHTIYDFEDNSVVCLSESDQTNNMTPAQLQRNILRIKQELVTGGPVSACYLVYDDFMAWNGQGIYQVSMSPSNQVQGGHAVVIVGWGVTDGANPIEYWICQNSWGTGWGQGGYWYHKIGDGRTFMESNCHAGTPKLDVAEIQQALSVLRRAPTGVYA